MARVSLSESISASDPRPAAYALLSASRQYIYKGACRNLKERLRDHQAGRCPKTRHRRPLELLHFEYCRDYSEALKMETFLKSGQGRKMLKSLLSE
ncbi:MAG: GIY-YIG nuclease family protein [Lentisphaerales bacterium]|jgi:predicted GIY-YIG superfamily endonuclease|nr:MAG: GIY-YIG nuclease family protein [Lentisphaerales bacterium]